MSASTEDNFNSAGFIAAMNAFAEAAQATTRSVTTVGQGFQAIYDFYEEWKRTDPEGFAAFQRYDFYMTELAARPWYVRLLTHITNNIFGWPNFDI